MAASSPSDSPARAARGLLFGLESQLSVGFEWALLTPFLQKSCYLSCVRLENMYAVQSVLAACLYYRGMKLVGETEHKEKSP